MKTDTAKSNNEQKRDQIRCNRCSARILPENAYRLKGEPLCADCCMDRRCAKVRKTRWQYITSIKTDYLREPES